MWYWLYCTTLLSSRSTAPNDCTLHDRSYNEEWQQIAWGKRHYIRIDVLAVHLMIMELPFAIAPRLRQKERIKIQCLFSDMKRINCEIGKWRPMLSAKIEKKKLWIVSHFSWNSQFHDRSRIPLKPFNDLFALNFERSENWSGQLIRGLLIKAAPGWVFFVRPTAIKIVFFSSISYFEDYPSKWFCVIWVPWFFCSSFVVFDDNDNALQCECTGSGP